MGSSGIEFERFGATIVLAAVVAVAAVGLSVAGAMSHPLWSDEVASARVLSEPTLGDVLERIRKTESTPPAWYILAWGATEADAAITEGGLFTPIERLRLLSLLFAAAASVLTALWALRLLGDRLLAALAGFLVACGSVPATYAEQLRAYALLTLLAVAFGLLLVEASFRPTRRILVALTLSTWLGVLTHYFFAFTVVAGGVWLWSSRPRLPGRRTTTFALALGLLGFLPWLASFEQQVRQGRYGWIGSFEAGGVVTLPGALFFGPEGILFGVARLVLTGAVVVGVMVLCRRTECRAIVALALLPIAGAAVVWAFGQPIFNERNLLAVAPFMAILVAASVLKLPRRFVGPVALAGLAATILGAAYAQATLGRIEYHGVAESLVKLGWTESDSLAMDSPTGKTSLRVAVGWYLPGHPTLARATVGERKCATLFAIGHSSGLGSWLRRSHHAVDALREFRSYDHPFRGRRNGSIIVARFRDPVALPEGDLLHIRGKAIPCTRPGS